MQPGKRVEPVLFLCTVALRLQNEDTLAAQAAVGQRQ